MSKTDANIQSSLKMSVIMSLTNAKFELSFQNVHYTLLIIIVLLLPYISVLKFDRVGKVTCAIPWKLSCFTQELDASRKRLYIMVLKFSSIVVHEKGITATMRLRLRSKEGKALPPASNVITYALVDSILLEDLFPPPSRATIWVACVMPT